MKALTRSLITAAVVTAAGLSTAYAADSAQAINTASANNDITVAQPMTTSSQNGFWYVGYGSGFQYSKFRTNALVDHYGNSDFNTHMSASTQNWLNNLFVGYGHYTSNGYYLGGELNVNYANAQSLSKQDGMVGNLYENHSLAVSSKWSADLDVLFGHKIGSQWLGYGKLGASYTNLQYSYELTEQTVNDPGEQYYSNSKRIYGILAGLGARYQFAGNWDIGVEADYTYYPTQTTTKGLPFNANAGDYQEATFGFNPYMVSAKATISYRF